MTTISESFGGVEDARAEWFFRRARRDFADRDDPELGCTCSLCWAENISSVRALRAVAVPGMDESALTLAAWEWMHGPGPWAGRGR